jgi:hypothetical protein
LAAVEAHSDFLDLIRGLASYVAYELGSVVKFLCGNLRREAAWTRMMVVISSTALNASA